MKKIHSLKDILIELYPLHRTLVSNGTDRALKIIGEHMPDDSAYEIETYPPGEKVWTWTVPERYVVHEAYLEMEDGTRIIDFNDNPLHLVSYSPPINQILTWRELEPHLHYSTNRPNAIPWEFKYYERDWGFCLPKSQFDKLPRDKKYRAVIRSEFVTTPDQGLRIGVALIKSETKKNSKTGEILVCSHVCHPFQANDDISGVVTAIGLAQRLIEKRLLPNSMSVRFLFVPETIGTICYLSYHENLIPNIKGGIFCEMTGNNNSLILQRTRQDAHLLDRISRYALERCGLTFREGPFREVIGNDEMVINGPGVNIPCISISRWPYEEYHTSDDSPDIIHEEMLEEALNVIESIVRIYSSNYIPKRTFRGPVFLSGYGLWVDWRDNMELNRAIEKIMLRLEGDHSIFDISEELNLDYWDVLNYVEKFRTKNLVTQKPIISSSEQK